ncbi:MAG: hypothetical protein CVV07_07270 [Gammaproteobacteria bacterium HGW-Gammaproteobacteria-11]|nr:MAG: hypothetical protein CVV07_07270 [Gammaproteobacteria bacterium HGW-Gammaproteobacteria-11]
MSMLKLNTASLQRLPAQLTLNGTFQHTLRNAKGVSCAIEFDVLQCSKAIQFSVKGGPMWLSCTLARPVCLQRVVGFIESATNGTHWADAPYSEESDLVTEIESTLREVAVKRQGTYHLSTDDDIWVSIGAIGNRCRIEIDSTAFNMQLPTNTDEAYSQLHQNLHAFINACRATAHTA